jgi:hypothetical protein
VESYNEFWNFAFLLTRSSLQKLWLAFNYWFLNLVFFTSYNILFIYLAVIIYAGWSSSHSRDSLLESPRRAYFGPESSMTIAYAKNSSELSESSITRAISTHATVLTYTDIFNEILKSIVSWTTEVYAHTMWCTSMDVGL